ncbi:MerR family transcriptional regulator [Segnochrobactrum spirostomi]|uniref:MerR family transcriptional regulator n=1 Tax=Segnochrobactrum spirostomi TaxID=2608987 RepID=A0A6A7Y5S6_9HYPH|nr:MerR family transcriptional regulator [Segnochrobactrum spirostomi]MQT14564.1 MerR family transcriptional regulator [Segnochrobactrum spirostomi]
MQIGDLAKRTGISIRMLRYYEAEGLLVPSRRASGYRDYDETDEEIARRIRLLSEAGLKLDAIRILLPCVRSDRPDFEPCAEVLAALKGTLATLEAKIAHLDASRTVLAGYLERLG